MKANSTPNRPVWQAEKQDAALAEKVRQALCEVSDPELGLNVIQLGLIRDVAFEPGKVAAWMVLTTPFCPYGPAMVDMTRQKAQDAITQIGPPARARLTQLVAQTIDEEVRTRAEDLERVEVERERFARGSRRRSAASTA